MAEVLNSEIYDLVTLGINYRLKSDEDCILLFKKAFEKDKELALKALFYLRDCRKGTGERRFFRVCFHWFAQEYPEKAEKFLDFIPEYGRYDDWFVLFDTVLKDEVCKRIKRQLTVDMMRYYDNLSISNLGKWMPSENAHSKKRKEYAKVIREYLELSSKQYRKMLTKLREHLKVLETLMSANRWDEIEVDKIPAKARFIYRDALNAREIVKEKERKDNLKWKAEMLSEDLVLEILNNERYEQIQY